MATSDWLPECWIILLVAIVMFNETSNILTPNSLKSEQRVATFMKQIRNYPLNSRHLLSQTCPHLLTVGCIVKTYAPFFIWETTLYSCMFSKSALPFEQVDSSNYWYIIYEYNCIVNTNISLFSVDMCTLMDQTLKRFHLV